MRRFFFLLIVFVLLCMLGGNGICEETADAIEEKNTSSLISVFLDFTNQNPVFVLVSWIITTVGTIIGIITGIDSIIDKFRHRKVEQGKMLVFERAQREWEEKFTQEQISELKKLYLSLEKQVEEEIPKRAKRVALENQLQALNESIVQQYTAYENTKRSLTSMIDESKELDEPISFVIKNEIIPFQKQKERRYFKAFLVLALLFLFPTIPEVVYLSARQLDIYIPIENVIPYLLGVIACTFISIRTCPLKVQTWIKRKKKATTLTAVGCFALWILVLYTATANPFRVNFIGEIAFAILSLIPLSLGISITSRLFS